MSREPGALTGVTRACHIAVAGIFLFGMAGYATPEADDDVAGPTLTSPSALDQLVETYFRTTDSEARRRITKSIEDAANGSIEAAAKSVRRAELWIARPQADATFEIELSEGDSVSIAYRLPASYDPSRPYPAIMCLPGDETEATPTCYPAADTLGTATRDFVLICPARQVGGSFHQPLGTAASFRRLVRQVRRHVHIDPRRLFLFGIGRGGDAAWMTALAHADLFAGVVVVAAYPPVPYPEQVYPFLLPNLRRVPVLSVWRRADHPTATVRQKVVAAHNRAIAALAKNAGFEVVGVEVPPDTVADLTLPTSELAKILQRRRELITGEVSHWFRYPGQGNAGWLRQEKYAGEVWTADQLAILPAPRADRDRYTADVVKEKMAYLGGRIEDQTIVIQTRRCGRVGVLVPLGSLDWSRPIAVSCNGKRRHQRRIVPSIRTLLEEAYETWDFRHLAAARISLSVRTDTP